MGINVQRTAGTRDCSENYFTKEYIRLRHGVFAFFAQLKRM